MAALLPTILSDDEAEFSTTKSNSDGKKKRSKKTKTPLDCDDEGNSSNDEMDSDFEFGGLLVSSHTHIICAALSFLILFELQMHYTQSQHTCTHHHIIYVYANITGGRWKYIRCTKRPPKRIH